MSIISLTIILISFFLYRSKDSNDKTFWQNLFSIITVGVLNFYCKGTPTKVVMYFLRFVFVMFEAIAFSVPLIRAGITDSSDGFWSLWLQFQIDGVSIETVKWFLIVTAVVVVVYFWTYKNEDKIIESLKDLKLFISSAVKGLSNEHEEIIKVGKENSTKLDALLASNSKTEILPFIPISTYASIYEDHGVHRPEDNAELKKKREQIAAPGNRAVRVLALSGTGKTYQILLAFQECGQTDDVYYCDMVNDSRFANALKVLAEKKPGCTLVLDNCNSKVCEQVLSEYATKFKIVSAHYDPIDRAAGTNEITYNEGCLHSVIDGIIESNANANIPDAQKQFIKKHCGGIPLMALLLTQAYNKTGNFSDIHDRKLMDHLLSLDSGNEEVQRIAMRTVALFQPLDFDEGNSKIAEYVMTNNNFTSYLTAIDRKEVFKTIVNKLYRRSLIEKDSVFVNMRPQPLACWLVGEWLREKGSAILETITDLASQPKDISAPLLESWAKRLEFMQGIKDAEDLYDELVKVNGGPFANEDVICSDYGSRLILAMATVNPVAVSDCLYHILYSKTSAWLRTNLIGEARRNIVRTLEKLCFCKDSFSRSALVMARLAISENEDWANNARGQFLQLFHIALAGTECNLQERYEVIKTLYEDKDEYKEILIPAIKGAFEHQHLTRMGGPEKFGFKELQDYIPTWGEIDDYWDNLWTLLQDWIETTPDIINPIADIIVCNTRMLVRAGRAEKLFGFIAYIAGKLDYRWNAMHKALVEVKNFDVLRPQDGEELLRWIEKLTPKDIVGKMRDAVHDLHSQVLKDDNALCREESIVIPYVEEFVASKGYLTGEMNDVIANNHDYISWAFSKHLALKMPVEDLEQFWKHVLKFIETQEKDFYSQFLLRFTSEMSERDRVSSFIKQLYDRGYYNMAMSLMGVTDDDSYHWLGFALDSVSSGELDASYIRNYMNVVRCRDVDKILQMGNFLKSNGADSQLIFDHFATYWYLDEIYTHEACMAEYKDAILNYPYETSTRYNHEFNLAVESVLEKTNDDDFVRMLNHSLIEFLSNNHSHFHVEDLYKILLTKYYDIVWPDFAKALTDIDEHAAFYFNVHYAVGSGFDFGEKCLFAGHHEEMKQLCKDYKYGAWVCAGTCPVFDEADKDGNVQTFHPFAIWLIENYGDKEHVIEEFSANMGTFHWTGSSVPLYEDQKRCLTDLLQNRTISNNVREWATKRLEAVNSDTNRELQNDAYMRMAYGRN